MIGAIIGDIVGSTREFANVFDYDFELFPKGSCFTDDTVCTIAIADAILRKKPYRDCLAEWCRRYPTPMGGYGASFSRWIYDPVPYDSFGNGAIMRISPVGWAFNGEKVRNEATKATACSHSHEYGIQGAVFVATIIEKLRKGEWGKKEVEEHTNAIYGNNYYDYLPRIGEWDETCQGCAPLAASIFCESCDFEDAIRMAISHGGDSDTLGAVVGGIAGAYYRIPETMRTMALNTLTREMRNVFLNFEAKYC